MPIGAPGLHVALDSVSDVGQIALVLVGAVVGFMVNELLGRGVRRLERGHARRDPLIVHVETDPSIIWVDMPPWVGAGFLVPPGADLDAPPAHCPDWRSWVRQRGGIDEAQTQLRVTLVARKDLVVVVDGVRVRVHKRTAAPPWLAIQCMVGGASVTPRRGEIDFTLFDPPLVDWLDESGDRIPAPTYSLSDSDVEVVHLWANVGESELVEWTAELLLLVDGQRLVVTIADGGRPFVTAGAGNAISSHSRASGSASGWQPPIEPSTLGDSGSGEIDRS